MKMLVYREEELCGTEAGFVSRLPMAPLKPRSLAFGQGYW